MPQRSNANFHIRPARPGDVVCISAITRRYLTQESDHTIQDAILQLIIDLVRRSCVTYITCVPPYVDRIPGYL
jgi:hypothetical protein